MRLLLAAIILPILATVAAAEERPLYSAHDSIRKAGIGSYSPRLAPPVRVAPPLGQSAKPSPHQFDRMECKPDPARPLQLVYVCTPKQTEKVN